jgi:hypothetical protein
VWVAAAAAAAIVVVVVVAVLANKSKLLIQEVYAIAFLRKASITEIDRARFDKV